MAKKASGSKLGKLAFYSIVLLGAYFLTVIIMAAVGGYFEEVLWMGMAGAVALTFFAGALGWNYVFHKAFIYKIVYLVTLCLVVTGIVLPCFIYLT